MSKIGTVLSWLSCKHFYDKRHCWRSCFIFQFFVGLTITSLIFNFWPAIASNIWYLYAVIGGFGYSGIAMIYYLAKYGRR